MYIDCCVRFAGNPWRCDCDAIYTVYRTFRQGTRRNITLQCENPSEVKDKSWAILEVRCEPTVTSPVPPPLPKTTGSTANTTSGNTVQSVGLSVAVQQESSSEATHTPSAFLLIFVSSFAAAVCIAVVVLTITIRRLRTPRLKRLWWEDVVTRQELMSD